MQKIDWLDVLDIAIELNDTFPEIDPQWISFPDLQVWKTNPLRIYLWESII